MPQYECNSMWKRDSWTRTTKEFSFEIWSHIETLPISGTLLKQRLELFRTHMPQNSENRVFDMFKGVLASCFTLFHHFLLSFTYHFGSLHVLPRCHRFFQGWWQHWWPRRAVHAQPADAPATNDSWRTANQLIRRIIQKFQQNHINHYQTMSNHYQTISILGLWSSQNDSLPFHQDPIVTQIAQIRQADGGTYRSAWVRSSGLSDLSGSLTRSTGWSKESERNE